MIEFKSDDYGIEGSKTNVHDKTTDDDVSKTGEDIAGISKTSMYLGREMRELEWNEAPKKAETALDLEGQDKSKKMKNNSPMEVHGVYNTILASDAGKHKHYKDAL